MRDSLRAAKPASMKEHGGSVAGITKSPYSRNRSLLAESQPFLTKFFHIGDVSVSSCGIVFSESRSAVGAAQCGTPMKDNTTKIRTIPALR